ITFIKRVFKKNTLLIIPTLMIPIAIFTTITGVMELNLLYIPVVLPLILRMGYDRMTAFATVILGSASGFIIAMTAPATVGLAQTIAGIPLYSGLWFRIILFILFLTGAILYVMHYARKINRQPELSPNYEDGKNELFLKQEQEVTPTARHYGAFIFLGGATVFMIYGLLQLGWYFIELGAVSLHGYCCCFDFQHPAESDGGNVPRRLSADSSGRYIHWFFPLDFHNFRRGNDYGYHCLCFGKSAAGYAVDSRRDIYAGRPDWIQLLCRFRQWSGADYYAGHEQFE